MDMTGFAPPALAEQTGSVADCKDGGCPCLLTDLTQADLAVLFGLQDAPCAHTVVIVADVVGRPGRRDGQLP